MTVVYTAGGWDRSSQNLFNRVKYAGRSRNAAKAKKRGRKAVRPGVAPRHRRAYPTRTIRKKKEGVENGYPQWTMVQQRSGRKLPVGALNRRLLSTIREPLIFGFRNMKAFDDYGAIQMNCNATYGTQPLACLLLNGINRTNRCEPFRKLTFKDATKQWQWSVQPGLDEQGLGTTELQTITGPWATTGNTAANVGRSAFLEYVQLKMNLWGAKSKAVRWSVQIIQPLSDEVNPYHWAANSGMGTVGAQAWEEMIKQYTYNPIARIDHNKCKAFKVVKSFSCIIEPTSTTESDADPHVKTLNWFLRVNKVCHFDNATVTSDGTFQIQSTAELKNNVDTAHKSTGAFSVVPRDRESLILLVRCSDYNASTTAFDSNIHGSFDIDVRTKYVTCGE